MRADDVALVEEVTGEAFHELEVRTRRVGDPEPQPRSPERARAWRERTTALVASDPAGCWVAENAGRVLGAAVAIRRDLTWILVSFGVRPGFQGLGLGRQLLDASLTHARHCLRGMLASSNDPAAARRYRLAGFTLHPTMYLEGPVPRSALPVVEHVREGSAGDFDLCDSVDRQVRDAAHGIDHPLMAATHRLLVTDRPGRSGYAYVDEGGSPYLLAATSRRTAADLLWECLASAPHDGSPLVRHLTAEQEWALDVGMEAGMTLRTYGYLALRGMRPPSPYVPSGHFL